MPVQQNISVSINNTSLTYLHATEPTLSNINLHLPPNQWTCLLGPSGCGKTSLLRLIAGLIDDKHDIKGSINYSHGNDSVNQPSCDKIAYMAQQDLLLPWLNVIDNICIKSRLTSGKVTNAEKEKAQELLKKLALGDIAKTAPEQLSGGMKQRVALARTLMQDTPIVLMDEPFSALDAVNRYNLQNLAAEVLKDRTVLLITHDPQEALRLSDHLFLFDTNNQLKRLALPASHTPRTVNAELGEYQQQVLAKMQVQHDDT